jgi:DNA-directed RNA polymerase specialized sigma24 family protein
MEKLCNECRDREKCVKPCEIVEKFLWEDNHVMEKHFLSKIVCYPLKKEVQFSGITEEELGGFSEEDVVPWSSEDLRLTQTAVFVERFFNKMPCKELAERFGVKENTIVCMYKRAVEQLEIMIQAMDARREGLKATRKSKFTDDQKFFLLTQMFGFNGYEVAQIFGLDHRVVSMKVKRMADKYLEKFKLMEPEAKKVALTDPENVQGLF